MTNKRGGLRSKGSVKAPKAASKAVKRKGAPPAGVTPQVGKKLPPAMAKKACDNAIKRARTLQSAGVMPLVLEAPPKGFQYSLQPVPVEPAETTARVDADLEEGELSSDDELMVGEAASASLPPLAAHNITVVNKTRPSTAAHPGALPGEDDSFLSLIPKYVRTADHVVDAVRQKIWQDMYVDFASLLPGVHHSSDQRELVASPSASDPDLVEWRRTKPTRQVDSLVKWNQCWAAFSVLHLVVYPERAAQLIQYGAFISHNSYDRSFPHAYDYDVAYRQGRSKDPDPNWAVVDPCLFTAYIMRSTPSGVTSDASVGSSGKALSAKASKTFQDSPKLPYPCKLYNTAKGCFRKYCKFTHKCSNCETKGHTQQACKSKTADASQQPGKAVLAPSAAYKLSK